MSTYGDDVKTDGAVSYLKTNFKHTKNLDAIDKEYRRYEKFFRHNYGKYLPRDKDARILDMACGIGETLHSLNRMGYVNAEGIDYDADNVAFCKRQGLNAEQGNIYEYFEDKENTFDAIILNDIIEHIGKERVTSVLGSIRKALNPGGILLIKTVNAANPILACAGRYMDFTHETIYEEASMSEVLELSGFKADRITVKGSHLYCYWLNPLNYLAWLLNGFINLFFRCYCVLNFRKTKIFTKNIIAAARK